MRYREILKSTTVLTELNTPSNAFNALLRDPAAEQAVVALIAAKIVVPLSSSSQSTPKPPITPSLSPP